MASFAVQVGPTDYFEVACATDPRLFHPVHRSRRTPRNFYSSRARGLVRAANGEETWMLPPDQLRRFAGAERVYYALGRYANPSGSRPSFTISPDRLDQVPSFSLSRDFTGRGLDRLRSTSSAETPHYGAAGRETLRWGGDDVLERQRQRADVASRRPADSAYDDGFGDEFWSDASARGAAHAAESDRYEESDEREVECHDAEDSGQETYGAVFGRSFAGADDEVGCDDSEVDFDDEYEPLIGSPIGLDFEDDGEIDCGLSLAFGDEHGAIHDSEHGPHAETDPPEIDPSERDTAEIDTAEIDTAEIDTAEIDTAELDPADIDLDVAEVDPIEVDDAEEVEEAEVDVDDEQALDAMPPAAEHEAVPRNGKADGEMRAAEKANGQMPAVGVQAGNGYYGGAATARRSPAGKHPAYLEVDEEYPLPAGAGVSPLEAVPLDVPHKVGLLRVVGRHESGEARYSAINPDREYNDPEHPAYHQRHIGLSWGLIQFAQSSGNLGKVLLAAREREGRAVEAGTLAASTSFAEVFGPAHEALVSTTNAPTEAERIAPVEGHPLWEEPWITRFRRAGEIDYFQNAQNQVGVEQFVDANLQICAWLGFDTDRAIAMFVDRCVNMGNLGGRRWLLEQIGPVQNAHDRDTVLAALGHATVTEFQQSYAPALQVDGAFGPKTHAAMVHAIRQLPTDRRPKAIPPLAARLDTLVHRSKDQPFGPRVAALRKTTDGLGDTVFNLS